MTENTNNDQQNTAAALAEERSLETLMKAAGPRQSVDAARYQRVYKTSKQAWQASLQRQQRTRRFWRLKIAAGIAASLFFVIIIALNTPPQTVNHSTVVARVVLFHGKIMLDKEKDQSLQALGTPLFVGDTIRSANNSGLSLQLGFSQSLRVDQNTDIDILGPRSFALHRGALYFDSDTDQRFVDSQRASIEVITPQGRVRDIGTQFEIRLNPTAMRVSVREGKVAVQHGGVFSTSQMVRAREQLTLGPAGKQSQTMIAPNSPTWHWAQALAPEFILDGRPIDDFLRWYVREQGLILHYQNTATQDYARQHRLHGTLDGMKAQALLSAVSEIGQFHYRHQSAQLTVFLSK